jgi:hypothetical protein
MTLLAGWKAECLTGHFQTDPVPGLKVDFAIAPPEVETALRLKRGVPMLDREFLMLYGDNFCPIPLERAESQWIEGGLPAQLSVYDNSDGYSRSNADWAGGRLTVYDASRSRPGLRGVEIGFTFLRRELVAALPERNQSIGEALFPKLAEEGQAGAFVTRHRYFGPGNPARLRLAEQYFTLPPTAVLRQEDVEDLGVNGCVLALRRNGWRVIVLKNNQKDPAASGGAGLRELERTGVHFLAGSFSTVAETDREIQLNPLTTAFLSSRPSDAAAADRFGCAFVQLTAAGFLLELASRLSGARRPCGPGAYRQQDEIVLRPERDRNTWQSAF